MRWLVLLGRILVGGLFLFAGLAYFLMTLPVPEGLPEPAIKMMEGMGSTGWLTAVKVLEVTGGVLLLSGRFAPVGLVLLTPVAVNIALWDVCVMRQPGLGVVLTVLCAVLVVSYWRHFAGVFTPAKWV